MPATGGLRVLIFSCKEILSIPVHNVFGVLIHQTYATIGIGFGVVDEFLYQ